MAPVPIDSSIESFITNCINSVEQLEILLLLRQHKVMDAETITRELRTSLSSVEIRLSDLTVKNLATKIEDATTVRYEFDPHPKWIPSIDQLAVLYSSHRTAIINLIFSKPRDPLQDFSEAFRIREKDK